MNTNGEHLIWIIAVGLVTGWLAGLIMKGRGFGVLGDIVVGILGAMVGSWLFSSLGIAVAGTGGVLLMALIGAIVLLGLISVVKRA
jgi:uncharacterized membrane protein YeaQ/YmgE (transglycosylase-associated protein family)